MAQRPHRDPFRCLKEPGVLMNTATPSTGDVYLVVGYDGSAPAVRALDAAAALLRGRDGSIDVVYVPHMPSVDMLSPGAVAGMETTFDEIARDLHAQASEQLRGREERWRFERGQGMVTNITDALIGAATRIRDAHPGDNVAIVIGSSSQAMHRMVGSVAVSLARHAPVPLLIVP
jgi:nucleotide-binding universal stress UspA family protein